MAMRLMLEHCNALLANGMLLDLDDTGDIAHVALVQHITSAKCVKAPCLFNDNEAFTYDTAVNIQQVTAAQRAPARSSFDSAACVMCGAQAHLETADARHSSSS